MNRDLANDYGNLVQRVLSMIQRNCDGRVPEPDALIAADRGLLDGSAPLLERVRKEMAVQAMAQLPPGAVPAFLGAIVLAAVLIDPWVLRRRLIGRIVNRLRGLPPPPEIVESAASESVQTAGTLHEARAATAGAFGRLLAQREVAAVLFAVLLWLVGFYLRPDFWGSLDNSFNLLLAFTEVGLMAVGMAYVVANGDIGSVEDARECLLRSGAAAVMVGRAAVGRPWLVGRIGAALQGRSFREPSPDSRAAAAVEHYETLLSLYGTETGLRHARKHLAAYADAAAEDGFALDPAARRTLVTSVQPREVTRILRHLYDRPARKAA